MTERLHRAAATVIGLAVALSAAGCAPPDRDAAVVDGIVALSHTGSGDETLADMTGFDWDEVYLFAEGTSTEQISVRTGIELPGGLIAGDHLYNSTLVFLDDDRVVETVQTTGAPLAFDTAHTWQPYAHPGILTVTATAVSLAG